MIFTQDLQRLIGWGSSIVDKVVDPLLPGDQFFSSLANFLEPGINRTKFHKPSKLRLEYAVITSSF